MNTLYSRLILLTALILAGITFQSCNDDNLSDLRLDGSTMIRSLTLGGYEAEIDNRAKTVAVGLPVDCDLTALTLDEITLEEGATSDIRPGDVLDCSIPHSITITNGDVYTRYTLIARHDNAEVTAASLNNKYPAAIDNEARTIRFFVPIDEDIEAMALYYTLTDGATGDPEPGTVIDFTDEVTLTVSYRTATIRYAVSVVKDDMSQAPKAFIGNADSVDALTPEARAAADWMLANVANSRFVSLQSVLSGDVKLGDFTMIWCHLDWLDWPGIMWDTRDLFNDYYIKGGNILASRDGARYINDVWRIALDQQSPNNMFGGEIYETLADDLGFNITGHEDHPLFAGLPVDASGKINLAGAGCRNSGRCLQWMVDWDAYGSMSAWESKTGATALASGNTYDPNAVVIAEFAPREILSGYTSGRVVTIGTPGFEWYDPNSTVNPYRANIEQLAKNSINYLCK
ncbi:MAG: DUF4960 domain-containing protein [Muribaculaceae bacterium]|nr:DUF4960 domain-containing protein [Muribaculaceae bacterium]